MSTYLLWENDEFTISTPENPHQPYADGLHLIVSPRQSVASAWADINTATQVFKLSAEACKIMKDLQLAPWFNIQANGNWGLLPGNATSFHVHVFGRNKTASWGKPISLPQDPGTYKNDAMPEADRTKLIEAFGSSLND